MIRWLILGAILLVVTAILVGTHLYVSTRLIRALGGLKGGTLWGVRCVALALALSFPLTHLLLRDATGGVAEALNWIAAVWLGLFLYILLFTVLLDAGLSIARLGGIAPHLTPPRNLQAGRAAVAGVAALVLALGGWGLYQARFGIVTTEIEAQVKNLPPELDRFSIVQISDLHIGAIIGAKRLRTIVDRVNALDPDLIVITGDLADEDAADLADLAPELHRFRARQGVLAVAGNHDAMAGLEAVVAAAAAGGVRFLRNEKTLIAGGLAVYGIDDPAAQRRSGDRPGSFDAVIGPEAATLPSILLYHRPIHPSVAAGLGIDLMLSGHTHRGQMWPLSMISRLFFPYQTGSYMVDSMLLYVSRGVGTWGPPMRIASPPEVVRITLRPGAVYTSSRCSAEPAGAGASG